MSCLQAFEREDYQVRKSSTVLSFKISLEKRKKHVFCSEDEYISGTTVVTSSRQLSKNAPVFSHPKGHVRRFRPRGLKKPQQRVQKCENASIETTDEPTTARIRHHDEVHSGKSSHMIKSIIELRKIHFRTRVKSYELHCHHSTSKFLILVESVEMFGDFFGNDEPLDVLLLHVMLLVRVVVDEGLPEPLVVDEGLPEPLLQRRGMTMTRFPGLVLLVIRLGACFATRRVLPVYELDQSVST